MSSSTLCKIYLFTLLNGSRTMLQKKRLLFDLLLHQKKKQDDRRMRLHVNYKGRRDPLITAAIKNADLAPPSQLQQFAEDVDLTSGEIVGDTLLLIATK